MFTLSGVYSSLSFRCKCQILSGCCGLLGYITGTEGIVMKQDKILKILKGVYNRGDPPLSIPNREVKPLSADGTALWWESRLAPNFESSHEVNCDCFFYLIILAIPIFPYIRCIFNEVYRKNWRTCADIGIYSENIR